MAKGTLWISGARGVTTLLNLISTIMLARMLVPSDFGLVALASTMLTMLTAVTNLSVALALVYHQNPTDAHYHTAWTLGVARGLVLAASFCVIAWPVSRLYAEPRLDDVMYALSAVLLVTGFTNPRLIMLNKKLVFWQLFVLQSANSFVMALVSVTAALIYDSYWALVVGAMAGQLTSTILSYILLPFRPRISFRHVRELMSFSIWVTLGQAVTTMNYRFDNLLLGGFVGRATLGQYSVGSNLAIAATREAIQPLHQTLFPAFALVADNRDKLIRAYQRVQATVSAIALPIGIGFALIADPLVRLAMGDKWAPAVTVIQVLAAAHALATLGGLVRPLALAQGQTRLLFNRAMQVFVIRTPLVVIGTIFWGLVGLLYARAIMGLIGTLINLLTVRSLIGLSLVGQLAPNIRSVAASAAMAGLVLGAQVLLPDSNEPAVLAMIVLAQIALGAATYLTATALLWVAMGRPGGPETEAMTLLRVARNRLPFGRAGSPRDLA